MSGDLLPTLEDNQGPTGEALLDDFLSTASVAQIAKLLETIGTKLAADDPSRAASRTQLIEWIGLWQNGGAVGGVQHAARPKILDEEMAGKAATLADKLRKAIKAEEDSREPAKKPLHAAGRAVDTAFTARKKSLQTGLDWINGLLSTWQAEERARLKRESEAAAARAREAEEKARQAAISNAPDETAQAAADEAAAVARRAQQQAEGKIQVRGSGGALATSRVEKHYRVTDWKLVPVEFLLFDPAKVRAAFKAGLQVAGIEEYEEEKTANR